jgi:hypothetical protein
MITPMMDSSVPSDVELSLAAIVPRGDQRHKSPAYQGQLEAGLWQLVTVLAIALPFGLVAMALCALFGLPAAEYVPVVAMTALLGGRLIGGFCWAQKTAGETLYD